MPGSSSTPSATRFATRSRPTCSKMATTSARFKNSSGTGEQRHTAQFPRSVVIHYRWHPLCGQSLTATGRKRWPVGDHLICHRPDGTGLLLPEWMTVPEHCAALRLVDSPHVSVAALVELLRLLAAAGQPPTHASMPAEASHPQAEVAHAGNECTRPVGIAVGARRRTAVWDDLPPSSQAELRALLRRLLVAAVEGRAEAGHDQ